MNDTVLRLVHQAMPVFVAFRAANLELLDRCRKVDSELGNLAMALAYHVAERQQSSTLLIQQGKLWDGEILLRSASEAVLKLLFICMAEENERATRLDEYLRALPALADLRQSERARVRLSVLSASAKERPIFQALILTEAQEQDIRNKWRRPVRQALNQKWSFVEMVEWVNSELAGRGLPDATRTLLHGYGISSHLIHSDARGLDLVRDRHERSAEVRLKLENAHAARLLSDMLSYSGLLGIALTKALDGVQTSASEVAHRLLSEYSRLSQPVFEEFYDSQESFYSGLT